MEAIHLDQLREHGGRPGLRDENALESALNRPKQKWHFDPRVDHAALAAAYGFGLSRNHPFIDGNKRVALVAMLAFLLVNGHDIRAGNEEVLSMALALASGRLSESRLAEWLRRRMA